MVIEGTMIPRIVIGLIAICVAWFLYKKGSVVWAKAREDLFTPHGFLTTLVHVFVTIGVLGSFVWFNVEVMGNQAMIGGANGK